MAQPAIDVIGRFDFCVPVAPQWMHATVTRIPWWRNEVDDRTLGEFGRALDTVTASMPAFTIKVAGPASHETSVGMDGPLSAPWQQLLDGARDAARQIFGTDRALPAPPTRPHVSLGYCVADTDSQQLETALQPIDIPIELVIEEVCFVAVHQDPGAGTFTWDLISSHQLSAEG
ncbi:2'-5' RNA ligase family protein [Nocardia tengchongensis]